MHFDVCFLVGTLCAGRFGLGWTDDDILVTRHMIMHFSCIRTILFSFWYICWLVLFSLSLSLSQIVCAWHPSANPLYPKTLFVLGHHLLLTLLHSMSGFVIWRLVRTSRRTSPNVAFIQNATLSYWTSQILIYWLSFTSGDGSLFVRSRWVVPPWSYRSFTPICMDLIIPYLISLKLFEVSV